MLRRTPGDELPSTSGGHFLRASDPPPHRCKLPDAWPGTVWRCNACHRRYTCWKAGDSFTKARWRRRWWPWPR